MTPTPDSALSAPPLRPVAIASTDETRPDSVRGSAAPTLPPVTATITRSRAVVRASAIPGRRTDRRRAAVAAFWTSGVPARARKARRSGVCEPTTVCQAPGRAPPPARRRSAPGSRGRHVVGRHAVERAAAERAAVGHREVGHREVGQPGLVARRRHRSARRTSRSGATLPRMPDSAFGAPGLCLRPGGCFTHSMPESARSRRGLRHRIAESCGGASDEVAAWRAPRSVSTGLGPLNRQRARVVKTAPPASATISQCAGGLAA